MNMSHANNNLAWLGTIPDHWQVLRLRQILTSFSEKNHPYMPLLSVVREKGVIIRKVEDKEENHNYVPDDLSGYKLVKQGQFAMNKMKAWQGSYGVSQFDGIVSPAYFVFDINRDMNKDFFNRAIRSKVYVSYFGQASDGIRVGQWDLSISRMKDIPFCLPPRDEQDQIVRFLDWKVSKINSLINIKKKKIYEYEEWKHSEICYIVTCGVSKEIAKKRTAEAWVPEIPEHWDMRRIKFLFDMRDERNYRPLSDVNLISLYTQLGVVQNKDVEYTTGNRARNADGYKIVHKNDIIVNIILCWMGAIGMSNYDGVTSPAYDIYIPKEGIHSRYYHYLFRTKAFSGECYKAGKGIMAMRWRTYSPQFRNISVPLPPLEEQIEIAAYLDERCATIDRQIEITQQQIQQLRELKDRLIADAVTGKIDVRNIQIPDYEYVDEEPDAVDSDEEIEEQEGE